MAGGGERAAQRLSLEWPSVTAAAARWPRLPLWTRTEITGLTRPAWAATRSRSGATVISTLSSADRLPDRVGNRRGGGGAQARRRLGARVGEHPGVADEAGRDQRDADPARGEVGAQAEREAAQAELGRVVDGGARARRLARQRGDEDEVAGAALEHLREERPGEQHRRLEVDAQGALHLLGGELGQPARRRAGRRWRRGCRPRPPPPRGAPPHRPRRGRRRPRGGRRRAATRPGRAGPPRGARSGRGSRRRRRGPSRSPVRGRRWPR